MALELIAERPYRAHGHLTAVIRAELEGELVFVDTVRLTDAAARQRFTRQLLAHLDGRRPVEADAVRVEQRLIGLIALLTALDRTTPPDDTAAPAAAPPAAGGGAAGDRGERLEQYLRTSHGFFLIRYRETRASGVVEEHVPLANFTAEIAEDIELDDGAETRRFFVLRGRLDDRPLPPVRVSVQEFAGMQWPAVSWGVDARVAPGQGRRDYLRDAIQAFSRGAIRRTIYAHTGWRRVGDRWAFLHAGGALSADGPALGVETELPAQLRHYAVPPLPDDPDAVRAAVRALLRALDLGDPRVTYPSLATVLAPPLGPALGLGFAVWLLGSTGRWKSTLQALLLNTYSEGAGFTDKTPPCGWESSDNALERLSFVAKDLPFWIDDFRPPATPREATELERRAQRLIREAANGVGRDRMRADTTLRPSLWPRGLLWSSGEVLPGGQSTLARLLIVDVPAGWTDAARLSAAQAEADRYALAGAAWLAHVAARFDALQCRLPAARDAVRDALLPHVQHPQHALAAAKLIVAVGAWLEHAIEVGALSPAEGAERLVIADEAIRAVAGRSGTYAGEERPARRFLDLLRIVLRQRRAHLRAISGATELVDAPPGDPEAWGWPPAPVAAADAAIRPPPTPRIGWVDEAAGVVYLDPTAAVREVAEFSRNLPRRWLVSPDTLGRDLATCGLLVRTDPGKHLLRKRVGSERVYVWALAAADVRGDQPDDDTEA